MTNSTENRRDVETYCTSVSSSCVKCRRFRPSFVRATVSTGHRVSIARRMRSGRPPTTSGPPDSLPPTATGANLAAERRNYPGGHRRRRRRCCESWPVNRYGDRTADREQTYASYMLSRKLDKRTIGQTNTRAANPVFSRLQVALNPHRMTPFLLRANKSAQLLPIIVALLPN